MTDIYLDNAATSRPWPEVIAAMQRVMGAGFGNPSSLHRWGLTAAKVIEQSADILASVVGGGPWRVVFTSGGSESDALAILGSTPKGKRTKIVTTTLEHAAVIESARKATGDAQTLSLISAGTSGVIDPDEMAAAVDDQTAIAALCHVAAELGTVQPVAITAQKIKAQAPQCRFLVDAVQALPQLAAIEYPPEVDMVAISAHKIHGPSGIGALLIRPSIHLRPILFGGDQQGGLRPGTLNLPGVAGFATAAQMLAASAQSASRQMQRLTDGLLRDLAKEHLGVRLLGDPNSRAPGMLVLAIANIRSEVLLHALEDRGILAAASSACHATRSTPPQSLLDAGLRSREGALRLSLSSDTTEAEMSRTAAALIDAIATLRRNAPPQ